MGSRRAGVVDASGAAKPIVLTPIGIRIRLNRMRTTLDIPEELIEEARRVLGFKSKTDAVVLSLTELIRRRRIDELKAMAGHVNLDIDVAASRRRPGGVNGGSKRRKGGRPA